MNAEPPPELTDHSVDAPHFPHIWRWFCQFPTPIRWPDIKAWAHFSGARPNKFECETLLMLDQLRRQ